MTKQMISVANGYITVEFMEFFAIANFQ